MVLQVHIPDAVAIALGGEKSPDGVLREIAVALYARQRLTLAQASAMAGLSRFEFGRVLGECGIPRHYGEADLAADLDHARRS